MPAAIFLTNKFNAYMRNRVEVAMDLAEQGYQSDPVVPLDTGRLQDGIQIINRFIAAPRYRGILRARALSPDSGADYAAILNRAPRIAPRTRRYLRFEVGGEEVFSKGFDNVHRGWFNTLVERRPSIWREALIEAGRVVRY